MTALIASEFLKLRTTRSFWVLIGFTLGLVVLTTITQLATDLPADEDGARSLLSNVSIAGFFMLILGVVNSAGEYRHGTITSTFLVAPERRRVLVAKSLAHGLTGVLIALVSALLVLAIALPWLSSDGESLSSLGVSGREVAGLLATMTVYVALTAMLGVGVGALLTNQVAALVVVPVILFVVDPSLTALIDGYGKFSLSGIWASLTGGSSDDAGYEIFSAVPAGLLYLAYVAGITAITALIAERRDVA
jgi:ABC-2 type transport system permease protein